ARPCLSWAGRLSLRRGRKPLERRDPGAFPVEHGAHHLRLVAEALELAMLEDDPSPAIRFRREAHLDLGAEPFLILPVGIHVPREGQPGWRLPGEHPAPVAFAAVVRALEPAAAGAWLHDRRERLLAADVMRARPPGIDAFGERAEHMVLRSIHDDALAHENVL